MKKFAVLVCSALLFITNAASAKDTLDGKRVRLTGGYGYLSLKDNDTTVAVDRMTISPEISIGSRLTLSPFGRMNSMRVDLREKDGMPCDLSLKIPWHPSIGARVEYKLLDFKRLGLKLRAEFETPLSDNVANVSSFTPKGKLANYDIDTEAFSSHVSMRHSWRRALASAIVSTNVGRIHPFVEGGVMAVASTLSVTYDNMAILLLDHIQSPHESTFSKSELCPFYMAGAQIDLYKGFALRAYGSYIPTGKSEFIAAEGMLVLPIL